MSFASEKMNFIGIGNLLQFKMQFKSLASLQHFVQQPNTPMKYFLIFNNVNPRWVANLYLMHGVQQLIH